MKKILAAVLTAVMALSLMGCAGAGKSKSPKSTGGDTIAWLKAANEANIDNMQKNKGCMLEITEYVAEPWETHTKYVTYDGGVYASGSGAKDAIALSNEDYILIYNFCVDAYENDRFADYSEDVCDGETYKFVFYDTDGIAHELYSGCIDGNDALQAVNFKIGKYCLA